MSVSGECFANMATETKQIVEKNKGIWKNKLNSALQQIENAEAHYRSNINLNLAEQGKKIEDIYREYNKKIYKGEYNHLDNEIKNSFIAGYQIIEQIRAEFTGINFQYMIIFQRAGTLQVGVLNGENFFGKDNSNINLDIRDNGIFNFRIKKSGIRTILNSMQTYQILDKDAYKAYSTQVKEIKKNIKNINDKSRFNRGVYDENLLRSINKFLPGLMSDKETTRKRVYEAMIKSIKKNHENIIDFFNTINGIGGQSITSGLAKGDMMLDGTDYQIKTLMGNAPSLTTGTNIKTTIKKIITALDSKDPVSALQAIFPFGAVDNMADKEAVLAIEELLSG